MARISAAPKSVNAIARMPEPVPTSRAENFLAAILEAAASRNSMQSRVVACVPVPNAIPGSIVITRRRRNLGGEIHGGVTQKLLPTRRGLMNRFQECCQFPWPMIFHDRRGRLARGDRRVIAPTKRLISPRNEAPSSGAAKKASKPFFLRTTPGAPRSIKKFASASMFAGLARTESCVHDCATGFYATGGKSDQFAQLAQISASQILSDSDIPPAKAQRHQATRPACRPERNVRNLKKDFSLRSK